VSQSQVDKKVLLAQHIFGRATLFHAQNRFHAKVKFMTNYTVPKNLKGFQRPFSIDDMVDTVITITGVIAVTMGAFATAVGAAGDAKSLAVGLVLLVTGMLSVTPALLRVFSWNKYKTTRAKAITTLQDYLKSEYNIELSAGDCLSLLTRGYAYLPPISGARRTLHLDYSDSTFTINTTKYSVSVTTEEELGKSGDTAVEETVIEPSPVLPAELFNNQADAIKVKVN
jgi:hypothetical protein